MGQARITTFRDENYPLLKASILSASLIVLAGAGFAPQAVAGELDEARSLIRENRSTEALEKVNRYLAEHPDDAEARFLKGVALTESGNRAEAVEVFVGMTRDFPDLPEPYNNLAVLRALDGELEAARLALTEALRIHPNYATAHENLGDVYAKMAAIEFERAAGLDPANASARRKLSLVTGLVTPARSNAPPASMASAARAEAGASDAEKQVLAAVNTWMDAWSRQDVESYLGSYSEDFQPADGRSRDEWAALRRKRVSAPAYIRLEVGSPKVRLEDEARAQAQFTQSYESDTYSDRVVKRLEFMKENGAWKIVRETTVN
ncbi:MAG: tetratricopeptide repeat protein [Gammaproteobacteria bacterium]|nr:tetratricopeptide repeat protein [Gammaproteobacteria bacterium]